MDNEVAQNFLKDLGVILKEMAINAKADKDRSEGLYEIGALMAYHEVVSLMQSQARVFGIRLETVP
jgi:hypothetical protein